jgi:hypothetical protein
MSRGGAGRLKEAGARPSATHPDAVGVEGGLDEDAGRAPESQDLHLEKPGLVALG